MPIQTLENPNFISVDGAGRANAGGTVGVYVAGTSFGTLATIYSDQVKTTELTNPVTLDDAGTKEIWYDVKVDIQEKTKAGVLIRDTLNLDPNATATVSTGFNLATNGSFETDSDSDGQPDSWTISPYSGSAIAITSAIVTDGTKALEFNTGAAGSGGGTATSSKFAVTEGTVCSVAWSFYATNATTLNTFQIKWYDEADVLQSTSTLTMPASGSVPTSWTTYTDEVTAHASATQGEIVLTGISSGGSNLSSKAYFDGIKVVNLENMVTLAGTQTLTNKTLTTPTLNSPVLSGATVNGDVIAGRVLIEEVAPSAVASVDFETGIDSTYKSYEIELINVVPATNASNLYVRVQTGGATWESGASDYTTTVTTTSAQVSIGGTISNTASEGGVSGKIYLSNPSSITHKKLISGDINFLSTADGFADNLNLLGYYNTSADAVTGYRILFSSGNIASGTIRLCGVIS